MPSALEGKDAGDDRQLRRLDAPQELLKRADIEHGALFVYVQAGGTPKIKNYTFAGGSRTCKLHFNCASAHREKVRLAKKFQY
jgi:hypothetical protein